MQIQAFSKINLFLEVLEKRKDNFHNLRSVMQTLALCDVITIAVGADAAASGADSLLSVTCDHPGLPTDGRNLAHRAASYMMERFAVRARVRVHIEKRIPVAAGLGGGSADCAAVLVGMNRLAEELRWGRKLTANELREAGLRFGADVPFCVTGGTALAEGVGERLTELPPHPACRIVLACLPVAVSTAEVFQQWTPDGAKRYDIISILRGLEAGDVGSISSSLHNDLTRVAARMHPEIESLLLHMKELGAAGAAMSGSGPTVFGYFASESAARAAAAEIKKTMDGVYITQPERMRSI